MRSACFAGAVVLLLMSALPSLQAGKALSLLFLGTRHGERNPSQFLKDDPNVGKWGQEGINQLNKYGKVREYALGQAFRKRYSTFLSDQWNPNEFSATASSAERTQQTLQIIAAGIYPPKGWAVWNERLLWQPIPYTIDDNLLRAYNLECPAVKNAWKPPNDGSTPFGVGLRKKYQAFMDLAASKEGLKSTMSDMGDVADNILAIKERGLPLPTWINDTTFTALSAFAEAPQVGCGEFTDCRRLMAGYWANTIFQKMADKQKNPTSPQKLYQYATHNEILTSLFRILGQDVESVPFGTGAIIEYSTDGGGFMRLFRAIPKDTPDAINFEPMKMCDAPDADGWCAVTTAVVPKLKPMLIDNLKGECPIAG